MKLILDYASWLVDDWYDVFVNSHVRYIKTSDGSQSIKYTTKMAFIKINKVVMEFERRLLFSSGQKWTRLVFD